MLQVLYWQLQGVLFSGLLFVQVPHLSFFISRFSNFSFSNVENRPDDRYNISFFIIVSLKSRVIVTDTFIRTKKFLFKYEPENGNLPLPLLICLYHDSFSSLPHGDKARIESISYSKFFFGSSPVNI